MTRYEKLQTEIYESDIICEYTDSQGLIAHALHVDGDYGIFFNENAFNTPQEKLLALTHEYAHCKTGYLYNINSPQLTKNICEAKAWRQTIKDRVPLKELMSVLPKYIYCDELDLFELSEHFEVMPDFMQTVLKYYRARALL